MAILDAILKGIVAKAYNGPARIPDTQEGRLRLDGDGSLFVKPLFQSTHPIADQGQYFVATNPVPGTPITFAINATASETAGYFLSIQNTDKAGGRRVYLDYIRLIVGTVPASSTAADLYIKVDTVGFTSGGSSIIPVNANGDSSNASIVQFNAGALTTAVRSANARLVTRHKLRTVIPVTGDTYLIGFGSPGSSNTDAGVLNGTNPQMETFTSPPVIVGPGEFALLQLFFTGNITTASTFEFEVGWAEL